VAPDRAQLGAVMVRRLKSELQGWDGAPRFPPRRLEPIEVDYGADERAAPRGGSSATRPSRLARAHDAGERTAAEFVLKLLKEAPVLVRRQPSETTLRRHERTLAAGAARRATATPAIGVLRRIIDDAEEDHADDATQEEAAGDAVEAATRLFAEPTPEERDLLKRMRGMGQEGGRAPRREGGRVVALPTRDRASPW